MGFFGCGVVMAIDICFFLAITEMVVPLNHTAIKNSSAVCPVDAARVNSGFHRQVVSKLNKWMHFDKISSFNEFSRMLLGTIGHNSNKDGFSHRNSMEV